jgi:hypothetical protein
VEGLALRNPTTLILFHENMNKKVSIPAEIIFWQIREIVYHNAYDV